MRDFKRELIDDMQDQNVIKLDMKTTAPFEIKGVVTGVHGESFTIESYQQTFTRPISDILHYRLA